ncbi:hypothetical protein AYO41_04065 [Verrucomicrobia bacterium SCGC AG-212-E04]|nr:hypothetical protein AYO41_04065 [Verrucomicrobia bacterium SCGC AG-212-E04]
MIRSLIRSLLRRLGFLIITTGHNAARYVEDPPSDVFGGVLLRAFHSLEGLRFIQVGANDGLRADPIHRYVLRYHWTGCLLEPLPAYFQALRENYRSVTGLQFLNAALGSTTGRAEIFQLRPGQPNLPDWAWGLASLDRNRLLAAAAELNLDELSICSESVDVITWGELQRTGSVDRCDLLIIDTEGLDIQLLRMAPLAQLSPRVIHFEHACASSMDRLAIYADLLAMGYEISTDGGDTIAYFANHPARLQAKEEPA